MKAYWVAHINVQDSRGYQAYAERAADAIAKHGGQYLVRGGIQTLLEGNAQGARTVVIEFPSRQQAEACYQSEAYQKARQFREGAADFNAIVIEGCQP